MLTDHANLRTFMSTKELSRRQARWAERLAAFDFDIEYRRGTTNSADGPSHRPDYQMPDSGDSDELMLLPTLRQKPEKSLAEYESGPLAAMVQAYADHLDSEGITQRLPIYSVGALQKTRSSNNERGVPPKTMEPANQADTGIGAEGRRPGMAPPSCLVKRQGTTPVVPLSEVDDTMEQSSRPWGSHAGTSGQLQNADGGVHSGTGGLEHLIPQWIAQKVLTTEMAYEEPVASFTEILLDLQLRNASTNTLKEGLAEGMFRDAGN